MLFMDMPEVPPQYTPVIVAQASQAKVQGTERTIGICQPIENKLESKSSAINDISPIGGAYRYLVKTEGQKIDWSLVETAKLTLVEVPAHGILSPYGNTNSFNYVSSDYQYFGSDKATFLVEIGSYKVKVIHHFVLMSDVPGSGEEGTARDNKSICPNGYMWKISSILDANGNNTITSVEYLSSLTDTGTSTTDTASLAATLGASILSSLSVNPSTVTFNFADLPGGAVGQTTGINITLDTNAAGHNWFIDTTPGSNEEFLPTSNPYEWVAKAGSAAEGKMDMLSVLLHEYGHALGIDHSADGHDYMATTLTPGVRRMPSAEELALMQQLVAQAKGDTPLPNPLPQGERGSDDSPMPLPIPLGAGFGIAFLGRMRNSRYGGMSIDTVGAQFIAPAPQYEAAANATFTNLNPVLSPVEGTPAGWNTQGSVDIANGAATLNEVSTSQTRLSQVFMLNARDRYLSFKLSGLPLPNPLPQAGEGANGAAGTAQTLYAMDVDSPVLSSIEGTTLTSQIVTGPTHGVLTQNADGTYSYTPDLNYFSADSFSYRLSNDSPSTGQPCLTIKYGIGINAVA